MVFLYLVEWVIIGLILLFLFTQVIIPIIMDRPLFTMFDGWGKARSELADANSDIEAARVSKEIEAKRKIAETIKSRKGKV